MFCDNENSHISRELKVPILYLFKYNAKVLEESDRGEIFLSQYCYSKTFNHHIQPTP